MRLRLPLGKILRIDKRGKYDYQKKSKDKERKQKKKTVTKKKKKKKLYSNYKTK